MLAERRLKVREIAETVDISKICVGHIPHEILGMRKRGTMGAAFAHSGQRAQPLQSSVWCCLSAIRRYFCVVSWPSTKRRSTGTHQRQPERLWPPFCGIHKVWSTSTTWRRAKRSQGSTMSNYSVDSTLNCRKAAPFSEEKYALPPWQRTGSHLRRRHGQIGRIRLRTAASSTAFSRFSPVRLLFVSKLEKLAGQKFESNEEVTASVTSSSGLLWRSTLQTSKQRVFRTG